MRVRTIAAGVTLAALAGTAVPLALSGAASAKGSGTSSTVAITKCSPAMAIIGKTVTIHGTDLGGVTKVLIGGKNVTASVIANTSKSIKINPVPDGVASVSPNATTVKVSASAGSATNSTSCHFKKAPKKGKKS